MLKYKEMLEEATKNGVANEKTMWLSVANVEILLDEVKQIKPQLYWDFLRHQHELMYKGHYSEEFAEYDISKLKWEDVEGNKHEGAYWTKGQVLEASKGLVFPPGTTDCDKWVAFNSMYSDLSTICTDAEIIKIAYIFYFKDLDFDYTKSGKIWKYMSNV